MIRFHLLKASLTGNVFVQCDYAKTFSFISRERFIKSAPFRFILIFFCFSQLLGKFLSYVSKIIMVPLLLLSTISTCSPEKYYDYRNSGNLIKITIFVIFSITSDQVLPITANRLAVSSQNRCNKTSHKKHWTRSVGGGEKIKGSFSLFS